MDVTEVKVFPVSEEKLKAFVSVVFDHCFMVNDIKVIQGRDGLFISMPSRKKKNGKFKDVAHPLNNETRGRIEERVLLEYRRAVDGGAEQQVPADVAAAERVAAAGSEGRQPAQQPEETEEPATSLDEVAEMHLRDSFWTT
jgi:stage V sporulation protein G